MRTILPPNSLSTSDLHLGDIRHAKSMGFTNLDDHARFTIDSINEQVTIDTTLFLLGDIVCAPKYASTLNEINCKDIHLITGNRECADEDIIKALFDIGIIPMSSMLIDGLLLTHYPVHITSMYKYKRNLHGHEHNNHVCNDKYRNVGFPIRKGILYDLNNGR